MSDGMVAWTPRVGDEVRLAGVYDRDARYTIDRIVDAFSPVDISGVVGTVHLTDGHGGGGWRFQGELQLLKTHRPEGQEWVGVTVKIDGNHADTFIVVSVIDERLLVAAIGPNKAMGWAALPYAADCRPTP